MQVLHMANVKKPADRKVVRIQVLATKREREAWGRLAARTGCSLSTWLRTLAIASERGG